MTEFFQFLKNKKWACVDCEWWQNDFYAACCTQDGQISKLHEPEAVVQLFESHDLLIVKDFANDIKEIQKRCGGYGVPLEKIIDLGIQPCRLNQFHLQVVQEDWQKINVHDGLEEVKYLHQFATGQHEWRWYFGYLQKLHEFNFKLYAKCVMSNDPGAVLKKHVHKMQNVVNQYETSMQELGYDDEDDDEISAVHKIEHLKETFKLN